LFDSSLEGLQILRYGDGVGAIIVS
jgi:hypothetical protein